MDNKTVIVSGSSGFIGKNFLEMYSNKNFYKVSRQDNQIFFKDYKNRLDKNFLKKDKELVLLHLATHFSKDPNDNDLIFEANINFGKNLLNKLKSFNLKKIVYTNTMFNFYNEQNMRDLYYTNTKQTFSDHLKKFCMNENIFYEEIFLDNTFGVNDTRNKIIPLIVASIVNGKKNPILNPDALINLVSVKDVASRLNQAISDNRNQSSIFVQEKSFQLKSIYDYLNHYNLSNYTDSSLIKLKSNNYSYSMNLNNENVHNISRVYSQLLELIK